MDKPQQPFVTSVRVDTVGMTVARSMRLRASRFKRDSLVAAELRAEFRGAALLVEPWVYGFQIHLVEP